MRASDVILRARDMIGDPEVPYRWSDQVLLDWLFDAEVELQSIRPDSTMISSVVPATITRKNTLAQTLNTADKFLSCLVDYVSYRALARDSEHANNERLSSQYYQSFTTKASVL
jgi:hypothetical protein